MNENDILLIRTSKLREIIETDYLKAYSYIRSSTLAKTMLSDIHDIPYTSIYYDLIVKNWTKKVSKILRQMEKEGILSISLKTNRGNLYRNFKYREEMLPQSEKPNGKKQKIGGKNHE